MTHPWDPRQFASGARRLGRTDELISAANRAARRVKARDPDLPVILTRSHLAHLAGVPAEAVRGYVTRLTRTPVYRVFRLKKRVNPHTDAPNRCFRTICVPEPNLMRLQRWIAQQVLSCAAPHPASYAFFSGRDRGILEAAKRHTNCTWLVKMDVRDFFNSIGERRVYRVFRRLGYGALVSFEMARICTIEDEAAAKVSAYDEHPVYKRRSEGHLPQGAPTSPALANLAVQQLDHRLQTLANARNWRYTRYADDLAFSTDGSSNRDEARQLVALVKRELREFGLTPNQAKTVIAPPGARRIVLGLLVDSSSPRLTRAFRNNLETHLYALTAEHLGPNKHCRRRGFASVIGMRRHIAGLLAFAHYVERSYARELYALFNRVNWPV